jgi:hypothetical protein
LSKVPTPKIRNVPQHSIPQRRHFVRPMPR